MRGRSTPRPGDKAEHVRAPFIAARIVGLSIIGLTSLSLTQLPIGEHSARTVLAQEEPAGNASVLGADAPRPSAHGAVKYLFPEQLSVVAGKPMIAELHFRVADGLHVNSHKPYEKNLIPTNLVVVEQPGLKISAVDFPAGKNFAFSFAPTEKISVYSDEFILHAHLTAERGDHLLQGALRYQACDASTCFPPKTIPVAIDIIAK